MSRLDEPKMYHVIMHNDDVTTMDFVVKVLCVVFFKTTEQATQLMLDVHEHDSAIVGTCGSRKRYYLVLMRLFIEILRICTIFAQMLYSALLECHQFIFHTYSLLSISFFKSSISGSICCMSAGMSDKVLYVATPIGLL